MLFLGPTPLGGGPVQSKAIHMGFVVDELYWDYEPID
jgi:hypothetical protein